MIPIYSNSSVIVILCNVTLGILLIKLLLIGSPDTLAGPLQKINCHVSDAPWSLFCEQLQKESGVVVFYNDSSLNEVKVTLQADSISILDAVTRVLSGTPYSVSAWNRHLVVLRGDPLIKELPRYQVSDSKTGIQSTDKTSPTESEERYLVGRKSDVAQTLLIGKTRIQKPGVKATILGRIVEEESGEPAIGATMFIEETKTGAATDVNGFLTLSLLPGKYSAIFEHLGLEKTKYQLEVIGDGSFSVSLKKSVIQIKEVVVFGDRQMNIKLKDAGLEKISIKSIKEIPMLMGERDILKISQMLPGIVSVGEGSAGLNVRGGSSDQNAFYINNIPVYNTSHLFGFFPAFNADIIKDFSIYKGFIPAQFGGRLSSVFNVITRQGNRKRYTAQGGISPVAGNIVVEGPIRKDSSSFLFSARSTYSDWILSLIEDQDIKKSHARFNDFSGSLNFDFRKSSLSCFGYHSSDYFKLSELNSYTYSNDGLSVNYSHHFSNILHADFSLVGSRYGFSTIDKQYATSAYQHDYRLEHYEFRSDFRHMVGDQHSFTYGLAAILYRLDRGTIVPYGDSSLRNRVNMGLENGIESSVYIADNYKINRTFTVALGARYSLFTPLGPRDVYTYADGKPLDLLTITDTLHYGAGKVIHWYHEPDIRANLNIRTDDEGSIKLAFNQMSQNLFMLNNTIVIAPNTQWKLADYHLSPSRSKQVSLGIFRTLPKLKLEASVESFYKVTLDSPEFKDGADFLNNALLETCVLQGKQKAWGIEVFIKRNAKRLEGWLSYTYSRSLVTVDGGQDWNSINNGEAYPANFDIPHSLNLVLNYHISRRVIFSTNLSYRTGRPVTYPVSVYYINGAPYFDYSKRNEYRIPDYFRTDASLTFEGNLKRNKLLHTSVSFNGYNITGRDNAYSVFFRTEKGNVRSYMYSVIGVPIFTLTLHFKLGNYASE